MFNLLVSSLLIVFLVCSNFFDVLATENEPVIDYGSATTINLPIEVTHWQSEARKQLAMINEFRTEDGVWYWNSDDTTKTYPQNLGEVKYDYDLEKVAMRRAFETAVFWDHLRPNGTDFSAAYSELGYPSGISGENISMGYGYIKTAEHAMEGWKETNKTYSGQGHRRNMLNPDYKAVGVACVIYNNRYFWVQEFSSKTSSQVETPADDSTSVETVAIKPMYIDSWQHSVENYTVDAESTIDISDAITLKFRTAVFKDYNNMDDSTSYGWGYRPVSYEYNYTSTDTSIATVDSNGVVTGVSAGTVPITVTSKDGVYTGTVNVTVRAIVGYNALSTITVNSGTSPASKLPTTVTAIWSDDTTSIENVTWNAVSENYKNRAGGSFNVTGTITGYSGSVVQDIVVNRATISSITEPAAVTTDSGAPADLPEKVSVTWSNGDKTQENVTWNAQSAFEYTQTSGGNYVVDGTIDEWELTKQVSVTVNVNPATFSAFDPLQDIETTEGVVPNLPSSATIEWSDNTSSPRDITWDMDEIETYTAPGEYTANGTVSDYNGDTHPVSVKLTVLPRMLTSIKWATGSPTNITSYYQYDINELSGTIVATYNNNTTKNIVLPTDIDDITIVGYDSSSTDSTQNITIKYSEEYRGTTITKQISNVNLCLVKKIGLNIVECPKTSYIEGQDLDITGIKMEWVLDNGEKVPVSNSEFSIDDFTGYNKNSDKYGVQTITVELEGFSTTYDVNVREKKPESLNCASLSSLKTDYVQGQDFDFSGAVFTLVYDNGTSRVLSYDELKLKTGMASNSFGNDWDTSEIGTYQVDILYEYKDGNYRRGIYIPDVEMTVYEKQVQSIEIKTEPSVKSIVQDLKSYSKSLFDNGVLLVHNNCGFDEEISFSDSDVSVELDISAVGNKTAVVKYGGKQTSFDVTVIEPQIIKTYVVAPTKTGYVQGENFELDGAKIVFAKDNGYEETIDVTTTNTDIAIALDGSSNITSPLTNGAKTLVISYKGTALTDINGNDITINVADRTGISVKTNPTTTTYVEGTALSSISLDGLQLEVEFEGGAKSLIPSKDVSLSTNANFDSSKLGTQKIYVSAYGFETSFNVTIREKRLTGLTVETQPSKTTYAKGQAIDITGLVVKGTYDNGTTGYVDVTKDNLRIGSAANTFGSVANTNTVGALEPKVVVAVTGDDGTYYVASDVIQLTVEEKTVSSISILTKPSKLTFTQNASDYNSYKFADGKLKASCNCGLEEEVSFNDPNVTITGFDITKAGDQTVTVSYGGKSATFVVTVTVSNPNPGNNGSGNGNGGSGNNGSGNGNGANNNNNVPGGNGTGNSNSTGNNNGSGNSNGTGSDNGTGNNVDTPATPAPAAPTYSNEWVNGVWYDENGNNTYSGTLSWKSNSTGWWVEDSAGWYPVNCWQKIDGEWYYFNSSGYMASSEWYNGYWFNGNGTWDSTYKLTWRSNSTGWWIEDISGWWPSNCWQKIDGSWYYFDASGYMVTSRYIDGYWIGANGVCQ